MDRKTKRILVVDDDPTVREICTEVLGDAGYELTQAGSAEEAASRLGEGWDLVLSDVMMTGADGIALYRTALERHPDVARRFLFMTGDRVSLERVYSTGASCIRKPFRVRDLISAAEAQITKARATSNGRGARRKLGCGVLIQSRGLDLRAAAEDISTGGMKIITGGKPLEPGEFYQVRIDSLNINRDAWVVWSRPADGGGGCMGVRFSAPIPESTISGLA